MNGRSMDCAFPICPVPVTGSVYTSPNETLVVTPYWGRGFKSAIAKQVCIHFEGIVDVDLFADYATLLGLQTTYQLPKRAQIVKFGPSVVTSTFTKFLIFPSSDEYNFTMFCFCQESQEPTLSYSFWPVLLCKTSTLNSVRKCSLSCLQLFGK